jgi:hypothetical protein
MFSLPVPTPIVNELVTWNPTTLCCCRGAYRSLSTLNCAKQCIRTEAVPSTHDADHHAKSGHFHRLFSPVRLLVPATLCRQRLSLIVLYQHSISRRKQGTPVQSAASGQSVSWVARGHERAIERTSVCFGGLWCAQKVPEAGQRDRMRLRYDGAGVVVVLVLVRSEGKGLEKLKGFRGGICCIRGRGAERS